MESLLELIKLKSLRMAGTRFDASEAVRCTSIHARGGSIRTVALGLAGTGARMATVESAVTDMKSVRSLARGWTNPILTSPPTLAKLSHAVHSQRRRKLRLQATRKMNALTGKGRATASKVIHCLRPLFVIIYRRSVASGTA